MNDLLEQIQAYKTQEVQNIRRDFDEALLKAAAFSVGGEFRSLELDIRNAASFPVLVELKSILFPAMVELEDFQPLRAVKALLEAGLEGGVIIASDSYFLGGDPSWINLIKHSTPLAVIQRDFFIDPAQFYQGKAIGADGYLIHAGIAGAERLPGLLEAASEMGLEVYLELDRPELAETIDPATLTGLVVNLPADPAELTGDAISAFQRATEGIKLRLARCLPRNAADVQRLAALNFQGIILNDDFWQQPSFVEHFKTVREWCEAVFRKQ